MQVRDAVVRPNGIRTSGERRDRLTREGADRIDLFPAVLRSLGEGVLREDAPAFDVRLALRLNRGCW